MQPYNYPHIGKWALISVPAVGYLIEDWHNYISVRYAQVVKV